MVVRTYAPRGQTPVLRVKLTRDHLSAIGGITEKGRIFMQIQERAYCSEDVVRFLRLLLHKVSGNLLVIWDGSPIHQAQVIKKFLGTQEGKRLHLERLPGYAPERESPRARVEPAQTARIEKSVLPGSCSPGPRACARQRTPSPSAGDSAKLFCSRVGKRFVKNFSTPLFRERITSTERESHARAPKRSDRA
jgi:DDE superfamily endonuclease